MTKRECAIVMAYTGICMCEGDDFNIFHKYVEEKLGRPILTHELPRLEGEIKDKTRSDFLDLCKEAKNVEKMNTNKLLNKQKEKMKDAIKISHPDYETGHEMADDILCETLTLLGFGELVTLFKDVNRMYSF